MATFQYDEYDDEPGFWQRYRVVIGLVVFLLIAGAIAVGGYLLAGKPSKPRPPEEIAIHLLPPPPQPPPPPPPKLPPPPPEQKMVEQPPVKPNEAKPKLEKALDRPPGPPGPAASGPPSDFGLAGSGGGGGDGTGGGSRWGWYAGEVQSRVAQAIRENDTTKAASLRLKVRIWVSNSGSIVRATLAGSSGDVAIDDALKHQILVGLNLSEAPPADMPMPIVMLISEQRPN